MISACLLSAILTLTNQFGSVAVDTYGARVVSYVPRGGNEVFASFVDGSGGMPICSPWFGTLGAPNGPRHGTARHQVFELVRRRDGDESSSLELTVCSNAETRRAFPHDYRVTVRIRLGRTLSATMLIANTGAEPMPVTPVFHPYFRVGDATRCRVDGVQAAPYAVVPGPSRVFAFPSSRRKYALVDPVLGRTLEFVSAGDAEAAVWTPGDAPSRASLAKTTSTFRPGEWRGFVAVENGRLRRESEVILMPGETHTLLRTIRDTRAFPYGSDETALWQERIDGDTWPDGSEIDSWFSDKRPVSVADLGKRYVLTECGIPEGDGVVRTREIQALIDGAAKDGGVIVVPKGIFVTGGLHFRPRVHLYLEKGAVLRASDEIADYALVDTRLRGISLKYFCAVVNAVACDGFTLAGEGVIDGNGMKAWRRRWLRREWNPNATGLDEQRPRILFVSKSKDVRIDGVTLLNSPFWTSHYYDCRRLKIIGVTTRTEVTPDGWRGPATDGMDLDGVTDVLVSGCSVDNNDDGIVFKGGYGAWADDPVRFPDNRPNRNVLIEDCHFGEQCHACVGAGSECYDVRNVIVRRVRVDEGAWNLLRLKIRPDTPQTYAGFLVEDAQGTVGNVLQVDTFPRNHAYYEFGTRKDIPKSSVSGVRFRRIEMTCRNKAHVWEDPEYKGKLELEDPLFEDMNLTISPAVRRTHPSRRSSK